MFEQLTSLFQAQRLPQGILWVNALPEQVSDFVKIVLCQKPSANNSKACGQCKACLLFASEAGHPDLIWLKPEGKLNLIKIDQVRDIIEFLSKSAQQGGYRVVVFEQAEGLNIAAQNALLKSLEEPGANSLLLLTSLRPDLLLPTIKSRCHVFTSSQTSFAAEAATAFIDAISFDFDPLKVALEFKDAQLPPLLNSWYEFVYELLRLQQHLALSAWGHGLIVALENKAQLSSQALFQFLDELCELKALLDKKVALNQQSLLERLLIRWQGLI